MKLFESVTELVGSTPLVKISYLSNLGASTEKAAKVYGKFEALNPGSSVKDRAALAIIEAAEASGDLKPGGTIVEATSGNTGIALAMIGAARGYRVVITMPESMSKERRALIRSFGAELILTPAAEGMAGTITAAEKILADTDNAILANQFGNRANVQMHERTTGPEIWSDTDGTVDIFIAGIGTGGTVTGVGRYLKAQNSNVQIIGVEPTESPLLTEGKAGPHKIQGIGANFIPEILDQDVIDEVITIESETALKASRKIARSEGILVGISAGAALAATAQVAARPENAGKTIVVMLPDTGERYLSTPLFSEDMD